MNPKRPAIAARPPKPPRIARVLGRLVLWVPLLGLLGASGVYLGGVARLVRANLSPIVADIAGQQLHHEVRLGRITFKPGVVILDNVAVSNRATFALSGGEAALVARRVSVHYRLHSLLFDPRNAAHAIGDVVVDSPTVLFERFSNARFNISDIIKSRPKSSSKPFVGTVIVHNGTLHFRDYVAPARLRERPALNTLYAINTVVNCGSERYVYFAGTGQGRSERLANVSIQGDASRLMSSRYRVSAQVSDADAAYWADYFKAFPQGRITQGRANLDLIAAVLHKPLPNAPIDLSGRVNFSNVAISLVDPRVRYLPLSGIGGTALFTGVGVSIDGAGRAAGQGVSFHGTVFDLYRPQLAFTAFGSRINPNPLLRVLPAIHVPPGVTLSVGSATAQITGSADFPVVSANVRIPRIAYQGNAATDVRGRVLYANNVLSLPTVGFQLAAGGQGVLRATVNTQSLVPSIAIGGRVSSVDVSRLHLPPTPGRTLLSLGGIGSAEFLSRSTNGGPNAPLSLVANVVISHPRVQRTTLGTVRGRIAWIPGTDVVVRRAVVQDGHGGAATVSGRVPTTPNAAWNLAVSASGANLSTLLAPYAKLPIGGLAYAQARVTGRLATPRVSGTAQVYNGKFNGIGVDALTGRFAAGLDGATLQSVVVRRFPTEARVSGHVSQLASGNPLLALNVSLAQGDVQDFITLAQTVQARAKGHGRTAAAPLNLPTLTGTAQGAFRIAGRVNNPQVTGQATVTDATIDAYRFDKLGASVAYNHGTVRVDNGFARVEGGASVQARGQFSPSTGRLAAAVSGTNVNVDLFRPLFSSYADLKGILAFNGTLGGTLQSPTGALRVSGQSLGIDGQNIAPLSLAGRYANGVFTQTPAPLVFSFLPGDTDAEGNPIAPAPRPITYVIKDVRLELPAPGHANQPRAIALSASIPADAPEHFSHIVDTVRASRFAKTPAAQKFLASLDALPFSPDATVSIPNLTVGGTLDAPQIAGTLLASRITAGEDSGADSAQLTGTFAGGAKPFVRAQAQVINLRADGILVPTVLASGSLAGRLITLDTLDARAQAASLHASGTANLDGSLDASLDASNIPLGLFNGLVPRGQDGSARRLSGTVSALSVQASGPTYSPDLIGSLDLDKPALDMGGQDGSDARRYALDSIRTGAVTLTRAPQGSVRLLSVSDLAAFKGGRVVATLSGTLPLNLSAVTAQTLLAAQADQPLQAKLQIADLSVLALLSPSLIDPARTGGALTAAVSLGANQALQGQVDIANASVGLTGFGTGLAKIGGRILVGGGRITVQSLAAQSSKDGTVFVSGGGTLTQADLRVRANGFTLDETGKQTLLAQTFNSGARGTLDGQISLTGPWLSPRIATSAGNPLVVSRASGTVPSVTEPTGRIARISIAHAGGESVSTPKILAVVTQKVGQEFDPASAQRDLAAIRGLGYFNGGVKLTTERDPTGGISLTYTVAETTQDSFDPQFDIHVALGGARNETVSVRSSLLRADARGDVHVGGTLLAPELQAHLVVAKGQFILPPSTLLKVVKPQEGGENIVDARYPAEGIGTTDQPGLESRVDLTAQATVSVSPALLSANTSAASQGVAYAPPSIGEIQTQQSAITNPFGAGQQSQRYKITAHISGLLNVPNRLTLDLTSSPGGLTRQQMLAALVQEDVYLQLARGGGGAESALKNQLGAAISGIALPTLLSPLEDTIAGTFGLQDFSVDYAPNVPVQVTLSKELAPRLTATYQRAFGARSPGAVNSILLPPQYQLKLGYGISRHLQLTISTDDQRQRTVALEGIFGF